MNKNSSRFEVRGLRLYPEKGISKNSQLRYFVYYLYKVIPNFKLQTSNLKLIFVCLFISQISYSQLLTPLSSELNRRIEYEMAQKEDMFFTVWKPYYDTQLEGKCRQDSLNLFSEIPGAEKRWITRKFFTESFLQIDSGNFYLFADPVFDFTIGRDNQNKTIWTNTRGIRAGGRLGKYFAFATEFYENQGAFNTALDSIFKKSKIIPGQGRGRVKGNAWDYAHSSGYLSFTPVTYLNIRFGQGKQFIGDGYRSLLISDVSYNYPYFKATFQHKNLLYSWMLASTQNMFYKVYLDSDDEPYLRETMSVHLLSVNILKRLQLSLIQCKLYNNPDTTGRWKADFNLFNPFIFPGEKSKNIHPIWGINAKIKLHPHLWLYQQILLDNLTGIDPLRTGYQLGFKYFDVVGLKGLYLQAEFNYVKPNTYYSSEKSLPWSHFSEPLAHQYGNNFKEVLVRMSYSYKRWQMKSYTSVAKQLNDMDNTTKYFTNGIPYFTNNKKLYIQSLELSLFINPKTLMNLSLGYHIRRERFTGKENNLGYFSFSFRTSLINLYYNL